MDEIVELIGGFKLRQDDLSFRFGMDSALLSAFPVLKPKMKVCDLGAGGGCIALMLLSRQPDLQMDAIEISGHACGLIRENADMNGVEIGVYNMDYRNVGRDMLGKYDLVVSNPPYFAKNSGKTARESVAAARGEEAGTVEDFCSAAAKILKYGGELCLVYRPERLVDLFCAMRGVNIEPKVLRYVTNTLGGEPILALVQGKKGGKSSLKTQRPLAVRDDHGNFSREMEQIYYGK
ncbi:MAG: methyltransferase [Oscillospiraceae bacterium]|nr:methyltransferase [Oscillospiraceae bacterium]